MPAVIIVLCLALALSCGGAPPGATDPDRAAEKVFAHPDFRFLHADYRQIRIFPAMRYQMEIRGEMLMEHGKRFVWRTHSPLRSATLITPEKLSQWDAETDRIHDISATDAPWIAMIFDSQNACLSGDWEKIRQTFSITAPEDGSIRLVPTDAAMRQIFREIILEFAADTRLICSIRLTETGGDEMQIFFENVRLDPVIAPEKWRLRP